MLCPPFKAETVGITLSFSTVPNGKQAVKPQAGEPVVAHMGDLFQRLDAGEARQGQRAEAREAPRRVPAHLPVHNLETLGNTSLVLEIFHSLGLATDLVDQLVIERIAAGEH